MNRTLPTTRTIETGRPGERVSVGPCSVNAPPRAERIDMAGAFGTSTCLTAAEFRALRAAFKAGELDDLCPDEPDVAGKIT